MILLENTTLKDKIIRTFFQILENKSGTKLLDKREYVGLSMQAKPRGNYACDENTKVISITEEQLEEIIQELEALEKQGAF